MKLGRLALAAIASVGFGATALAGNGSNFLQLNSGIDFFYGGFYNPNTPVGTHGAWRCYPSEVLHAPTLVVNAGDPNVGTYSTKICGLHFSVAGSTGSTALWPNIVLSSNIGDCRIAPGGTLNFGFASSNTVFGTTGFGYFVVGPTLAGPVNLIAAVLGLTFGGPFQAGPTGAIVYGLALNIQATFGVSAISVPEGHALTYWIAEDNVNEGPGQFQYWAASEDERNICSSLSTLASALGTAQGAFFPAPTNREFGMFIANKDATLMACVAPTAFDLGGADTTMGATNPMNTGTGGRTLSLTGATPEGGNGLGFEILSFNSYDEGNAFGGSGKLLVLNLMAVNTMGAPSCGPWSAGYFALPTGGPGGPVIGPLIPQQPRMVPQLDVVAISLLSNPVWTLTTIHNTVTAGNQYPMFPGFAAAIGGSTGNNGGFGIPVPNLAQLVGVQVFVGGTNMNATNTAIAANANNGHSNQNGFDVLFFP